MLVCLFAEHVDCHTRFEEMVAKCQVPSRFSCFYVLVVFVCSWPENSDLHSAVVKFYSCTCQIGSTALAGTRGIVFLSVQCCMSVLSDILVNGYEYY